MFTKRSTMVCILLLASPPFASAQLRFTMPSADLGELRGGPVYQHRFDFVNDFTQPIEITDIRLGCGCLYPLLDKRTYQAGEKGTLLMHVRTLGQPNGARTWRAHVQYRLEDKLHETALIVAATIRNEVTIEPSIIALTIQTTLRQELTIEDHRPTPLKIVAIVASSPAIKVVVQPMDGGVTKVVLDVNAAALTAARKDETINIYTDDPNYRHLQVPITLTKATRAEVTATPDTIEVRGAGSQLVRLRAAGEKIVRIEAVDADQPALTCTWAAGPGNDATLKITADAAQFRGDRATVRVRLREPAPVTLTIPVTRAP